MTKLAQFSNKLRHGLECLVCGQDHHDAISIMLHLRIIHQIKDLHPIFRSGQVFGNMEEHKTC